MIDEDTNVIAATAAAVVDMVRQNPDHPMTRWEIESHLGSGKASMKRAAIDCAVNAGVIAVNANGSGRPLTYTYVGELDDHRPTRPATETKRTVGVLTDEHLRCAIRQDLGNTQAIGDALVSIAASLVEINNQLRHRDSIPFE
jgi:hypothetical protein